MATAIIDYGMGNVRSMMNALEYCGEDATITDDLGEMAEADRLVLPGVGAFGDAMAAIRAKGLQDPLTKFALEDRKPILGVCLGMQLFAKRSLEHGETEGLGWLDAEVVPLKVPAPHKVPHVGWNDCDWAAGDWLFEGIPSNQTNFYFVHSYHMVCADPADRIATCHHGSSVTAAVRRANLVATQFHPEKSQDNGIQLIENWLAHEF